MEWLWFSAKLAAAGLGPLLWHWGFGVGVIILILLVEYFSTYISATIPILGPLLERFRHDLLWLAVGIAVFLAGEYVGAKDAAQRCTAQATAVKSEVVKQVNKAKAKPGLDRWDIDQ